MELLDKEDPRYLMIRLEHKRAEVEQWWKYKIARREWNGRRCA
jgi:hypothetical protein